MGIRTIKNKAGTVMGFQALAGTGGSGQSRYFPISHYGTELMAYTAAKCYAEDMAAKRPRRVYAPRLANAQGIAGLRLVLTPSESPEAPPYLTAVATWFKNGRCYARSASTNKHGLLGAVARVRQQREHYTGNRLPFSDRQLLNRMQRALQEGK